MSISLPFCSPAHILRSTGRYGNGSLPVYTMSSAVAAESLSLSKRRSVVVTEATTSSTNAEFSKHPVLPPIPPSQVDASGKGKNPFVMPPESELFTLRERERRRAKEQRAGERKLKVHEKSTYTSRLNAKTASLRKQVISPDAKVERERGIQEDSDFVLTTTRDRHIEKEDLVSYVNRKREMFLVQYSLGVKRDEIRKLEEIASAEEQKLEAAEKYLEESATMFDEFLKENDKNAVEAIKMAEAATKAKLEKVTEIKRLNAQLMAVKNEMSRNKEQLAELKLFRNFLDDLAPQKSEPSPPTKTAEEDLNSDEEENVQLHFADPLELISIFTELEVQNLSLIQNSQETEETLEELKQHRKATEQKMQQELESLQRQVDFLKECVDREEDRAYGLETKAKMYLFGEYQAEDQEQMLEALDKKVADVYSKCIGANEANIPTLQMLTAIESKLEDLFETVESLPADRVEVAEKAKEKERRMRMREEKLEEQRLAQEERLRRALERAQAAPSKQMGRKLVYRSEPPVLKRKQKDTKDKRDKEEEELQYFFT